MSSRIAIDTLQAKLEFIVMSLGGRPDEEKEEMKRNQEEFDNISTLLKECMSNTKSKLKERQEIIKDGGFQSKERVLLDEKVKNMFAEAEDCLKSLRAIFKEYQNKNKRKVEQDELVARSKKIELLRKNLNLL